MAQDRSAPLAATQGCAQEPIHVPGRIQPHGVLLAAQASNLVIRHLSENAPQLFGASVEDLLGRRLDQLFEAEGLPEAAVLADAVALREFNPLQLTLAGSRRQLKAVGHVREGRLILEFELESTLRAEPSFLGVYRRINQAITQIEAASDIAELCQRTAQQVKTLTGFDRVMIYRFDTQWNGEVVAEAKEPHQEPFLHLHYPASDIPAQARELYLKNWLRLIPDVQYQPVNVVPAMDPETQRPLDLSLAELRSVSPVHIQYLKNMEVGASMSVSIIKEKRLWGLIALHHESPRYLPYELRQGMEFIGKLFSLQLAAKVKLENLAYRQQLKDRLGPLGEQLRQQRTLFDGLRQLAEPLLGLVRGATGLVIYRQGARMAFGSTPNPAQLNELEDWLRTTVGSEPVFQTSSLAALLPAADAFTDVASGLLCLSIPEPEPNYLVWLKPEVVQTVSWGGNPEKPVEVGTQGERLSPRRSFAVWRETVRRTAEAWRPEEVDALEQLRQLLIEVDLQHQVNAAMRSNEELDQFAHIVAHDLKEPLRGIDRLTELVEQDLDAVLTSQSAEDLALVRDLASKGTRLINELYQYSRLGRVDMAYAETDLREILEEVLGRLKPFLLEHGAEVHVELPQPRVYCDRVRLGEVFSNLITNGIKYNVRSRPVIEIGQVWERGRWCYFVRDNGIGVAKDNAERVFAIFQRLHGDDEYGGGTGSGLAIVQRIVNRHGGHIWLESAPGQGSVFYFTLAAN